MADHWFQPDWSLAVEEQFYLVVPLVIWIFSRRALYVALAAAIVAAPLLRFWIYSHPPHLETELSFAYTLMPCRVDALALGVLAALSTNPTFRSWLSAHSFVLYGLVTIFLLGFFALGAWLPLRSHGLQAISFTWVAVFYLLVLLAAISIPGGPIAAIAQVSWLREIGRVSYCLYLIHLAVLLGCQDLLRLAVRQPRSWQYFATTAAAAAVAFALARLSWIYLEHPLLLRGHNYQYDRGPAEASLMHN